MGENTRCEIGWQTLWRVAIAFLILYVLYLGRAAVGVFLVSVVISLGLEPAVELLRRTRMPRFLATVIVFLAGVAGVVAVLYTVIPVLIGEMGGFLVHVNQALIGFGFGISDTAIQLISGDLSRVLSVLSATDFSIAGTIGGVFGRMALITSTLIISFYLTLEERGVERLFKVLLPDAYERAALAVFGRFEVKIRNWFSAQLALSLVMGTLVGAAMWILGVPYALVLGLVAAVFELVPFVGPVFTGIIAFIAAVSESFSLGIYAVLFFFLLQQFENHVFYPFVMGKSMRVHPVIVIVSLLGGAHVAGFVGIILAVPVAVMAQEIFGYLAERKDKRAGMV